MPFRLEFADRYRLWSELLHSSTERVFLATHERPPLGSRIPVELSLSGKKVRIVLAGTVVGMRSPGGRFPAGLFLNFPPDEIEKCRRFLGLSTPGGYDRARKMPRVRCALPLQFASRAPDVSYEVRNLSDSGLLGTAPPSVRAGERLCLTITLDDGRTVEAEAEVSWTRPAQHLAGFRFVDLREEARQLIGDSVRRLLAKGVEERQLREGIVVAEDDPDILAFLTTTLSRHGYEVHSAQRGDEALALIRELLPEMVLMDILMPGIDGLELCKLMRADVEMAAINVIFISALEQERLQTMANEAGATDFLCKPVNLAELLNLVGRYLRK